MGVGLWKSVLMAAVCHTGLGRQAQGMLLERLMCSGRWLCGASVEMSCSSDTDLSDSFLPCSAWLDKLAKGLLSTNKLMPALRYVCLQINWKISFTADLFTALLSLPVCFGKDGKF